MMRAEKHKLMPLDLSDMQRTRDSNTIYVILAAPVPWFLQLLGRTQWRHYSASYPCFCPTEECTTRSSPTWIPPHYKHMYIQVIRFKGGFFTSFFYNKNVLYTRMNLPSKMKLLVQEGDINHARHYLNKRAECSGKDRTPLLYAP